MKLVFVVCAAGTVAIAACAVDDGSTPRAPVHVEQRAAADHCGGVELVAVRDPSVAIAPEDESLVAFYELRPPSDMLAGIPGDDDKRPFKIWLDEMARLASEAASVSPERRIEVLRHFADTLATLEIPAQLRAGDLAADVTAAFCDATSGAATQLRENADQLELQLALAQDNRSR